MFRLFLLSIIASTYALAAPTPLPPAETRPGAETGPTKVAVAVWATDIVQIDSAAQTFNASLFVALSWQDPRLTHPGPGIVSYALGNIWHPEWVVANDDGSVKQTLPERADVQPDGRVLYRQRYVGPFMQKLDLQQFPFDRHPFRAHFVVLGHRPDEIQFVPDEKMVTAGLAQGVGIAEPLTIVDWKVSAPTAYSETYQAAPGLAVAGYTFEFQAARQVQHYLVKVIIPLLLIVMMSWTVFWIDPSNGGPQISVAVTSMLTLIAYRFAVGAEVPKLPYLTRLDAFILTSSLLVFFSLIEVMITTRLATSDRITLARTIDRRCRFIFPTVFLLCAIAIYLR
jgi:hypothetical protein